MSLLVADCVLVLKWLYIRGDSELNPGPVKEVLGAIQALEQKMKTRHPEVLTKVNEVKSSQKVLEEKMPDTNPRLTAVEEKVATLEPNIPAMEHL